MAKNLLIVESPAKAKTIEKILGPDYQVKSCFGHIRDLERKEMGININKGFEPNYIVPKEKTAVVKELKKLAKSAQEVWLATDEDREGEAISWHLCEVLGLDPKTTKRIVFHEITKTAIQKAVAEPRLVDMNLVNAQQARRILDRIVGFEISPVLWRKISMSHNLSAGRVQSVAVKLIVEREKEIEQFLSTASFKTSGIFKTQDNKGLKASLKTSFKIQPEVESFFTQCKGAKYQVSSVDVKPTKRKPSAPFTTSTLQQEASRKLGYSVSKTMLIAQRLYEAGYISYMRTDSITLSQSALNDIQNTITKNFGPQYHQFRVFKNKNQSAQEAHEAIRPTDMNVAMVANQDEQKLYDLIRKRTLASQMADAELEKTVVDISISSSPETYQAVGEVVKFDGFLKLYLEGKDDDQDDDDENTALLPPLVVGQLLELKSATSVQKYTRAAARYSEAALVKKMEELGIGRPSTYAPTISTIQKREYVIKGDKTGTPRAFTTVVFENDKIESTQGTEMAGQDRNKLIPTDIGTLVNDFLDENFQEVMNYGFTAQIENQFDEIAQGVNEYSKMLSDFYNKFHPIIEDTLENANRMNGERALGVDPSSGKPVFAKIGRYGPMVQIGSVDDEEKPRFAKLKNEQSVSTISLDEAMKLFELPRLVGEFEGEPIKANIGRFGPYLLHKNSFVSLKVSDPYEVNLEEAIQIIEAKREADIKKFIVGYKAQDIQVLNGRWGPFVKQGKENYKLNKEQKENAANLTLEECLQIIASQSSGRKPVAKAASKKSAPKKVATKKSATKKSVAKKTTTKTVAKKKSSE